MAEARIRELLRRESGFDAASISEGTLSRVLRRRMDHYGGEPLADYARRLEQNPEERMLVLDDLLVGETWFFRTPAAYTELTSFLHGLDPRERMSPITIYSLACSSGEEPYSIAMTLLDEGYSEQEFHVVGMDLNGPRLETARAGVYTKHSFHGKDLSFRDRHFHTEGRNYHLRERVRRCVSFTYGNLLKADSFIGVVPAAAIFCRNVLIYFNEEDRKTVLRHIDGLLAPTGRLFVGPAEIGQWLRESFRPVGPPAAFCYEKAHVKRQNLAELLASISLPTVSPPPVAPRWTALPASTPVPVAPAEAARRPQSRDKPAEPEREQPVVQESPWDAIRSLADSGRLEEAEALAERRINEGDMDPEGRHLLGVLALARRRFEEAESWFRQALYLRPDHEDSLIQLLLLMEGQERTSEVDPLRRRLWRLTQETRRDG